jgi:hypothetical protein
MSFTASELKDISKNWAQERTLGELRDKMASNNSILAAIAKEKFNLDTKTIRSFEDAIDDAKDGLTELQNSAEKAKRAQVNQLRHEQRMQGYEQEIKGNYKRSVDDLRSSLDKMSRFDSSRLYEGVTSGINSLSYNFRKADGSATGLSTVFNKLNQAVAIVAAGFGVVSSAMTPFQKMTDAGVSFGGSLEKMGEVAARSGLKLEQFQNIVGQYSSTIGGIGPERFTELSRKVQDTTREFGMYNQTVPQQTESLAAFVDMLALGGIAYTQSVDDLKESSVKYLREQTAMTELTGKQRKELEAERKAALQDTAIALRIRQLKQQDPRAANTLTENMGTIADMFGKDMARTIVGLQMGLQSSDPQMRAMMAMGGGIGGSMENISRMLTTASGEDMMRSLQGLRTSFTQSQSLGDFGLQAMAGGPYAGAADKFLQGLLKAERQQAAAETPGAMQRIMDIFSGRGGNIQGTALSYQKIELDTARTMGDFKAGLWKAIDALGVFEKTLGAIAGVTGMGPSIGSAFYGLASAGTTGAVTALTLAALPGILKNNAIRSIGTRLTGLASGGGLGLTSQLGSTGAGASLMRGASTMGGLGMGRLLGAGGLGVAGGLGGAYLGSKVGAPGWLGGALGGAATGALAGIGAGPGGILAGALLGGLVGGFAGNGIGSASAAEANQGDQTGNAGGLLQDSTALVEMQASSTSYVSAMAALVSRVAAQATMTSLAPPIAPQNDALLGMVTTLNSTVAAQTPYIQDQARQARITAGIIGDFA